MDLENASQAESSTATESVSTDSQSSTPVDTQASVSSESTASNQPTYTPNYDFKVYDKTHQFPEWARPVVKDKASEDQIRDVFSRAYGLDGLKSKYEKSKSELTRYADVESKFNTQTSQLKNILALRDTDMGGFLQSIGLTDDMLHQHYQMQMKAKEDPQFAAQYNQGLEAKRNHLRATQEQETMRGQMDSLRQEKEQIQYERHINHFDSALNQSHVSTFASQFDSQSGREGAFKDEAVELGNYIFMKEQRNAPPQEVFQMLMSKYGGFIRPTQPAEVPQQMAAKSQATIPNTGGGSGVSATKARFKSIDDIKKHYDRKYGDN
jgi:hypothetical protein